MGTNNKVKEYRKKLGLVQTQMADIFKISFQSYNAKERGRSRFTDDEMMLFKEMVRKIDPNATIDDIFFSE